MVAAEPLTSLKAGIIPRNFTMKQVQVNFAAKSKCMFRCPVTLYAKAMEDAMQTRFHHLPFGLRLHRCMICPFLFSLASIICPLIFSLASHSMKYIHSILRSISKGSGARPGDGQPGFLAKMGATVLTATNIEWEGEK